MKRSHTTILGRAVAMAAIMVLGGCASDSDDPAAPLGLITKTAILTGSQQTTSIATNAVGYGTVTVDPTTKVITGSISFSGIVTQPTAHIHTGAAGVNNSAALIPLTVDAATHMATIPANTTLTQQAYDDLLAGNLYFNVHSSANGGGEIRGQIGRIVMKAAMDGAQAGVPTSAAVGTALVVVDPVTKVITGSATYGLTASNAHIHKGAVGASGASAVDLDYKTTAGTASVPAGKVLSDADYADLIAGKLYVNIHSAGNTGGEIRGQIGPVALVATMDGAQEATPVTTTATGKAVFLVDPISRKLTGGVGYSGVTATGAHIHMGAVGVAGDAVVTLGFDNSTGTAVVPANTVLMQPEYDDLLAGKFYVNIHSAANGTGEIRGQIALPQ